MIFIIIVILIITIRRRSRRGTTRRVGAGAKQVNLINFVTVWNSVNNTKNTF